MPKFEPRVDPAEKPLPPDQKRNRAGKKRRKKNGHPNPGFDLRTEAYKLFGVDVTQVPGLEENALPLFSEVGRDLSKWPNAGHFISWLNLCPDNDISAGKTLWRGMRTVKNRAGHLLRLAASSLHHSPTPVGNYLRRMKASWVQAGRSRRPHIKSPSSSTPWSGIKLNTTKQSGRPGTLRGRKGRKQGSNDRLNNWVTKVPFKQKPAA